MSQSNETKPRYPKIQVRNRKGAEGKLSVGANMEVLLDGKPLGSANFFKFEVHSRKIAKVTIELYAEVEIDANLPLTLTKVEDTGRKASSGKLVERHTLSSYAPVAIDKKE